MRGASAMLAAGSVLATLTVARPASAQSRSALMERDRVLIRLAWKVWNEEGDEQRERIRKEIEPLLRNLKAVATRLNRLEESSDESVTEMRTDIVKLQDKLQRLTERFDALPWSLPLDELNRSRDELRGDIRELQRLRTADDAEWGEFKTGIDRGLNAIRTRFDESQEVAQAAAEERVEQRQIIDDQAELLSSIEDLRSDWPGAVRIAKLEDRARYLVPVLVLVAAGLLTNAFLALRPRGREQIAQAVRRAFRDLEPEMPRRRKSKPKSPPTVE